MVDKDKIQDAVVCKENDSILEVSRIMRDTRSRHLIVVNENQEPVGIVSTVDINNRVVAEEKNVEETKASDVMTKPIESVDIGVTYDEAYEKIIEKGTYSIPVTENGKLVGLLDFNQIFNKAKEVQDEKH